jgi:hypothetical protein
MSQSVTTTNATLDAAEELVASLENELAELRAELWAAEQDTDSYHDARTRAEGYAALPAINERIDLLTPMLEQAAAIFHALDEASTDLPWSAR